MFAIVHALGMCVADLFKSRCRLKAENLLVRDQLSIALWRAPARLRPSGGDGALLVWMTRLLPGPASCDQSGITLASKLSGAGNRHRISGLFRYPGTAYHEPCISIRAGQHFFVKSGNQNHSVFICPPR